jgi:DDE superfamily endonuclease
MTENTSSYTAATSPFLLALLTAPGSAARRPQISLRPPTAGSATRAISYQGSDFITPFKKPQGGELLDWQKELNAQVNKLRAPVERAIAHLKSWLILHTEYRKPLRTYVTSYRTAVGLYFFKLNLNKLLDNG